MIDGTLQTTSSELEGSFLPFEQGTSLLIHPIPKPSIGAQESFVGGHEDHNGADGDADNGSNQSGEYLSLQDFSASDRQRLLKKDNNKTAGAAQLRYAKHPANKAKVESFEHLTVVECLNSDNMVGAHHQAPPTSD